MEQSFSVFVLLGISTVMLGQTVPIERNGQTITIEPYAPNVMRVTLSLIAGEQPLSPVIRLGAERVFGIGARGQSLEHQEEATSDTEPSLAQVMGVIRSEEHTSELQS